MTAMSAAIKRLEAGGCRVTIRHDLAKRTTHCMINTPTINRMPYFGEAKCREEDTWDFEYGANLAFFRALAHYSAAVDALNALLYTLCLDQRGAVMKMDDELASAQKAKAAKAYTLADYEAWARRQTHADEEDVCSICGELSHRHRPGKIIFHDFTRYVSEAGW